MTDFALCPSRFDRNGIIVRANWEQSIKLTFYEINHKAERPGCIYPWTPISERGQGNWNRKGADWGLFCHAGGVVWLTKHSSYPSTPTFVLSLCHRGNILVCLVFNFTVGFTSIHLTYHVQTLHISSVQKDSLGRKTCWVHFWGFFENLNPVNLLFGYCL